MLTCKFDRFVSKAVVPAIGIAIVSFIMVQAFSGDTAQASSSQMLRAVEPVSAMPVGDAALTAEFLKLNHQASGIAPNWSIYQKSLNYADHPTNRQNALPTQTNANGARPGLLNQPH